MSVAGSIGFMVGMILVIVISVLAGMFIVSRMNSDKEFKTKYDERQQIVRGKGYKFAFWTMVGLLVLNIIFDASDIHLPMKNSVLYFVIILIGIMVHTVYCVFNDGYFGMNNPPKQYYIFMFFIGLLNLVIGFINSKGGRLIDDGIIDTPFINLLCGMMFVVLGICIVIKRIISKSDDESDDEEDDEQ